MEATEVSIDRWMVKEDVEGVCVCNGISLNLKKEWNLAFCNHKDGPRECYAKWNMSDREREIVYDLNNMWNRKKQINKANEQIKQNRRRFVDTENELGVTRKEESRGVVKIGEGD